MTPVTKHPEQKSGGEEIRTDIAIIGLSVDFAQSPDTDTFWQNLMESKNCVEPLDNKRWPVSQNSKSKKKHFAGLIDNTCLFDESFFGISPGEALLMDPQQRLLLMHAWKVVEDAGYSPSSLDGASAGVFVGTLNTGYSERLYQTDVGVKAYTAPCYATSVGANRINNFFNFCGPSEPVDTACSSALVAIEKAVDALKAGRCDIAIAGAVNTLASPSLQKSFERMGALSKTNSCMPFSKNTDGYARSEGAGLVLLKPLDQAIEDNDSIYGVIKGYATLHGGRSKSTIAPKPEAQVKTLLAAYQSAGFDPLDVDYVEAHAVGSNFLDATEVDTLNRVLDTRNSSKGKGKIYIGSNKGNFGHTEYASGMASLAKVLLQFRHKKIAPTVGDGDFVDNLAHKSSRFKLVDESIDWKINSKKQGRPLRAGVSAFGFSGVYSHVILEEYENDTNPARDAITKTFPFAISAKSPSSLVNILERLLCYFETETLSDANLPSISYTLMTGRDAMPYRVSYCADSLEGVMNQIREDLEAFSEQKYEPKLASPGQMEKRLSADKDFQKLINQWLSDGKLEDVFDCWERGVLVDWNVCYHDIPHVTRLHLPTYQFDGKRYWIPSNKDEDESQPTESDSVDVLGESQGTGRIERDAVFNLVKNICGAPIGGFNGSETFGDIDLNSLKGLELKYEIKRELGVDVSLANLFSPKHTLEDLLQEVQRSQKIAEELGSGGATEADIQPTRVGLDEEQPLTVMQGAFLFGRSHGKYNENIGAHIFAEVDLVSGLDLSRLKLSWREVVKRQASLRIKIVDDERQCILPDDKKCDVKILDMSGVSEEQFESRLSQLKSTLECKLYQSSDWPFFEVYAIKRNDTYRALLSVDEIIADGLSIRLILNDWSRAYTSQKPLPALKTTFWDFVSQEKTLEGGTAWRRSLEYWFDKGVNVISGPDLPVSDANDITEHDRFERSRLNYTYSIKEFERLEKIAKHFDVSPTLLFLSIFSFVLSKFSRSSEFSLLTTLMKRDSDEKDVYEVVGPMITTTLFPSQSHIASDLGELCAKSRASLIGSVEHANICSSEVIREFSRKEKNINITPIEVVFTSMLGFDDVNALDEELIYERYRGSNQTPQIYLDHQVAIRGGKLYLSWDVAEKYYQEGLISEMFDRYIAIVDGVLNRTSDNYDLEEIDAPARTMPLTDQQMAYAALRQYTFDGSHGGCQVYLGLEIRDFCKERFQNACDLLLKKHSILKCSYSSDGVQTLRSSIDSIAIKYGAAFNKEELIYQFSPLDHGEYIKIYVTERPNGSADVHVCLDMLLADYPSAKIIVEDLSELYHSQECVNEGYPVFFNYLEKRNQIVTHDKRQYSKEYWLSKFKAMPAGPDLSTIKLAAPSNGHIFDLHGVIPNVSEILALCESHGVALSEVLLAAYMEVLFAANESKPYTLAIPCWDRFDIVPGVDRAVGDFTTMCWVEYHVNVENFIDRVMDVKRQLKLDKEQWPVTGLSVLRRLGAPDQKAFPVVFTDGVQNMDISFEGIRVKDVTSRTTGVEIDNVSYIHDGELHCSWHLASGVFDEKALESLFHKYLGFIRQLTMSKQSWLKAADKKGLIESFSQNNNVEIGDVHEPA